MQRTIVGRFRSRSDADGNLQCLRQLIPHASFLVVFDCQPDLLEFRLKRSDSASLSGAKFAFQNELDEMDRTAKSS